MRRLGMFFGLLTGIGVLPAQTQSADIPFTLTAAVDLALRDNAELKSLRARWEAMQERPVQVRALPSPMLSYSGMDMVRGGSWPYTNEKRFMVQQEFPWFGKRRLRGEIAQKDVEAMQREFETMTRDVVMMVKESYFELYSIQQVIGITRKDEGVLRRMAKIAEIMYTTGKRTQQDVLKAKAEITMLKQRLLELEMQENALKAKLNALLNRWVDAPLGAVVNPQEAEFSGDIAALFALAMTNRSEIRAAQVQVERYELEKKLMTKEFVPDYKIGLEYRDIGNSDDMVMFTVSVDWPVWGLKNRAGVREAEKMQASSQAAREAAERQSAFDVQDAHFKVLTAQRTLDLYRHELIPQAEARFHASEAGYQTGKVDFMDLLESQRFLLSARVMAQMAEGDVGVQSARLERAIGTDLKTGGSSGPSEPKEGAGRGN